MRRWSEDHAALGITAEILLIGAAVVGAGLLYAFVSGDRGDAPEAIGLVSEGGEGDVWTLSVTSSTGGLTWGRVALSTSSAELAYDALLSEEDTWCVEREGACILRDDSPAQAGDKLRVRDAQAEGATLVVRDVFANAIVWRATLG